jgi:lipoyl-dependent peroxiredoxin subunit D
MMIENFKHQLPDLAKDIKLNLSSVLTEEGAPDLTIKQIYFIALASAYAAKNKQLIEALELDVKQQHLSIIEIQAAKSAAIIMAMNNIYYRFTHLMNDSAYATMPAKLRMSVIGQPGIDKIDFELACLAISIINGCGLCMNAHADVLLKKNITKLAIQSCARIAAVINAAAFSDRLSTLSYED